MALLFGVILVVSIMAFLPGIAVFFLLLIYLILGHALALRFLFSRTTDWEAAWLYSLVDLLTGRVAKPISLVVPRIRGVDVSSLLTIFLLGVAFVAYICFSLFNIGPEYLTGKYGTLMMMLVLGVSGTFAMTVQSAAFVIVLGIFVGLFRMHGPNATMLRESNSWVLFPFNRVLPGIIGKVLAPVIVLLILIFARYYEAGFVLGYLEAVQEAYDE